MNIILKFVIYFLFFAIIHSFLAMEHTKNKAEKILGRKKYRFYRLFYTIISFPLFAPAFMVWFSDTTPLVYSIPDDFYPIMILVRLIALGMFGYAVMQIDFLQFTGIRQEEKNTLITGGAYGIVRHPLYTSGILMLITKMEMSLLDITAVLLIAGYFVIGAFIEERRLIPEYGDGYRKYQERVDMFIPVKWIVRKAGRK